LREMFDAVVSLKQNHGLVVCDMIATYEYFVHLQDLDGTGTIRYTEFLAATIEAHGAVSEQRLAEAFDRLDNDDSGYISAQSLVEMLGPDFPRHEIDQILEEVSMTKDNRVSYAEFLQLWEEKHDQERSDQLSMLGTEVMPLSISDTVTTFLGLDEDREPVHARASFILRKHDGKRMSFAGDDDIFHDAREDEEAVTID
jgi:EF-hand domain pair